MKPSSRAVKKLAALLICFALIAGVFPVSVVHALGDDTLPLTDEGALVYGEETTHDGVTFRSIYGKKVSTDPARMTFGELRYWVYLPEHFRADREYPLLVFLHGSNLSYKQEYAKSWTPWTNPLDLNSATNPLKIADKMHDVLGDYIIFVPQCPGDNQALVSGSTWTKMAGTLWKTATKEEMDDEANSGPTDYLLAAEKMLGDYISNGVAYDGGTTYGVDASRVYLIGDSMGAIGSYAMLVDCPTTFAAAVIRAGMGDTTKVPLWKDTPVFIAHGTADANVPYARCEDMLAALEAAGAKDVQTFIVPDGPHDIRPQLYTLSPDGGETYTVFNWLAQQSRSDYVIRSWEDYAALRDAVNSGDASALAYVSDAVGEIISTASQAAGLNVSLESDITISEPGAGIGTGTAFRGKFDGNGHTVTFAVDCSGAAVKNTSLFGTVNGTVRNVKLAGSLSYTDSELAIGTGTAMSGAGSNLQRIAPLATFSAATSRVENVTSTVAIRYTDADAAAPGTARHLTVTGLVGYHQGDMEQCTVGGSITVTTGQVSNLYIGGVTQAPMKTMTDVRHTGSITVTDNTAGGTNLYVGGFGALLGSGALTAVDCVNSGDVTVTTASTKAVRVGGFIGSRNGAAEYNFNNCRNEGAISAAGRSNVYSGGIIGHVANAANGAVIVGGFANTGRIAAQLKAHGSAAEAAAGALIGRLNAGTLEVSDSLIDGEIRIDGGSADAPLSNAVSAYAGGMVGYALSASSASFENCLVRAAVEADCRSSSDAAQQKAAGYVGSSVTNVELIGCFSAGTLTAGNGTTAAAEHYGVLNGSGGRVSYAGCGYGDNSSAAAADGVGVLRLANLPTEGVVSLSGTDLLDEDAPVWSGSSDGLPANLSFTGEGVAVDSGRISYADSGVITVTAAWCGWAVGSRDVTVSVCEHVYGPWQHTAVDTHSRVCTNCGDVQIAPHVYEGGVCVCGRTEDGAHEHSFSAEYRGDDLKHYHYCTWPGCGEIRDEAGHTYEDGTCTVCGRSAEFSDAGRVYEIGSASDYNALLRAVNLGEAEALAAVARNLAGDAWYVDGMTVTQRYAAALDVVQTADITLSYTGAPDETKPVGIGTDELPFAGDYDGAGHSITFDAISLSGSEVENIGLFGVTRGDIVNVNLRGSITYQDDLLAFNMQHVAPLAAYPSEGIIDHCTSDVDITYDNGTTETPNGNTELYLYGLIGMNKTSAVTNCSVTGDLSITNGQALNITVGGVAGQIYMVCEDVSFDGSINITDTRAGNLYVGGIAAQGGIYAHSYSEPGSSLKRLTNNGDITIAASGKLLDESKMAMVFAGGILSRNATYRNWTMDTCVNNGNICISGGNSNGRNSAGTIVNDNAYVGGLLGYVATDDVTLVNCLNTGSVTVINNGIGNDRSNYNARLGGLVGCHSSTRGNTMYFYHSVNRGAVHAENVPGAYWRSTSNQHFEAAGFVGEMNALAKIEFEDCVNYGEISSARTMNIFLGGIIGDARGLTTATAVTNAGKVWSSDYTYATALVGGFAGLIRSDLTINGFTNSGELIASLKNSANAGTVNASAGGVVGQGTYFTAAPTLVLNEIDVGGSITAKTNEKASGYAGYAFGRLTFYNHESDEACVIVSYYEPDAVLAAEQEGTHDDLLGKQESDVKDANLSFTLLSAPLAIVDQPTDCKGAIGDTAVFSVAATGDRLTYQWQCNTGSGWKDSGAVGNKTATLSIGITEARLNYRYRCVITDRHGDSVTTAAVRMTLAGPKIIAQPVDYVGAIGDTATFTVSAEGDGVTYQWQHNTGSGWKNSGAVGNRTATLSIAVTKARLRYSYRCIVTGPDGGATITDEVKMKLPGPAIDAQPTNFEGALGDTATFTVSVEGDGVTYQWQHNTGSGWKDSGAAGNRTTTLSIEMTKARLRYSYRCIITGPDGGVTITDEVKMIQR